MTHDIDALVKGARKAMLDGMEHAGTLPAKEAVKVRPADWHRIERAIDNLSTALQAEHEARVKAAAERDTLHWQSTVDAGTIVELRARATAAEAQLASAREALGKAETRFALIAAATTGSVSDAISGWSDEAREALRSLPAAAAGGEAPESNRCRDGHNFITVSGSPNRICRRCAVQEPPSDDAPSPQNIGQGLSEKGQNVSESEEGRSGILISTWACRAWGDGSSAHDQTNVVCPSHETVIASDLPLAVAVHIAGLHNAAIRARTGETR